MSGHRHMCARCEFSWLCVLIPKRRQKVCPVDQAVKVNRGGPFCSLCQHIIMAKRVAAVRGLTPQTFETLVRVEVVE